MYDSRSKSAEVDGDAKSWYCWRGDEEEGSRGKGDEGDEGDGGDWSDSVGRC